MICGANAIGAAVNVINPVIARPSSINKSLSIHRHLRKSLVVLAHSKKASMEDFKVSNNDNNNNINTGNDTFKFLTKKPYNPPSWASHLNPIPSHIFSLGHVSFVFSFLHDHFF